MDDRFSDDDGGGQDCEETAELASHDQPTSNGAETVENQCFGSHILNSKSMDSKSSDLPSSFATITKDYEMSIKDKSKHPEENSENGSQVPQFDSESSIILPSTNLQSLTMISNNYQDSSSESDKSDDDSVKNVDSDDDISIVSVYSNTILKDSVKTKGELDITDLPPIEDLKISVDEEKCQPVGCIKSIVDTLVVVEAFINQSALDIDSILFLDRGKRTLGKIFDVFGPVNKPYYAVRFNNSDHIKTYNLLVKEPVFCAPDTEYSSFVLVSQLLKMKGSDASWKHNNEPPIELLDYSDDEAEKLAKKKRKQNKNSSNKDNANEGNSSEQPIQNVVSRKRPASVDSSNQHQTFSQNSNRSPQPYSNRPPHFRACPSNYSSQTPNFNLRPPNFNPNSQHFNPNTHNFNYSQQNFNHSSQNYGYNQQPPFPTYAQQLSAMDYNHSYRQSVYQEYYNPNTYPPRPPFPYHNPQMPPPGYGHQTFPQTDPHNHGPYPNQMNYPR